MTTPWQDTRRNPQNRKGGPEDWTPEHRARVAAHAAQDTEPGPWDDPEHIAAERAFRLERWNNAPEHDKRMTKFAIKAMAAWVKYRCGSPVLLDIVHAHTGADAVNNAAFAMLHPADFDAYAEACMDALQNAVPGGDNPVSVTY
jgi:hypothetical protein